ncbi:MAG: hypothetical protein ABGF52_01925 [Candidatus Asgardarchaeum sp.]
MPKRDLIIILAFLMLMLTGNMYIIYNEISTTNKIVVEKMVTKQSDKLDLLINETQDNILIFQGPNSKIKPFENTNFTYLEVYKNRNNYTIIDFYMNFSLPENWNRLIVFLKRFYYAPYGNIDSWINMSAYLISESQNLNLSLDVFSILAEKVHIGVGFPVARCETINISLVNYNGNYNITWFLHNKTLLLKPGIYSLLQRITIKYVKPISFVNKSILEISLISSVTIFKNEYIQNPSKSEIKNAAQLLIIIINGLTIIITSKYFKLSKKVASESK